MNDDSLEQTLQKVSLMIIMTDTPEKLGKTLNKFLILFITNATASDERIRKISAETLAHINKRLSQQSTTIQLPILSLLEKSSPLCDIYLNHAFNNLSNYPDSVIKSVGEILFEKYPESIYILKFFGYDLAVSLAPEIKTLPTLFYDFMLYDGNQNCTGISLNKVAIFNKFASRNGVEDVGMILTTKLQIVAFIAKNISVLPEPELSLFYLLGLHCSGEQKIKTVCQRDWGKLPRNAIEESSRITKLLYDIYNGDIVAPNSRATNNHRIPCKLARKKEILQHICLLPKLTRSFPRTVQVAFDAYKSENLKMKELGVRFCRRILEQALQSKDDIQAKYYFPQVQLLSAFLQKVLAPPAQEHLQIISGNCKFMFADSIICLALLLSLDSNNKKRKMVQGEKFLEKFSRLFDLACGRYREEAEGKPLYHQENTGAPMMSVNTNGRVNVDVKISARQGVTLFANGQEICLVKQCLRHLETEVVSMELSNKTLVQNEVFLIAEVTLKLMENVKTRHYTEIILSEDYILKLAAVMNFSICDVLPELKETLQSIVKLWFQETIGNSGADSTINLTLSKMMGNEQLITSYVMEKIYETILKTGEKQQIHLKKFSELLVQIIISSKAKVTDELLMIAHEEIDAGTWQKIGAPAKSALLNLINLEKVSISSKLANVFILAGFSAEEADKISPTAELLLSSANFISAKISAQELVNLLANGSETVDQEAVVHVLEQILSMNVGVGDFGKLELVKDRLFVAHEKCQSGSRKKVLLSGLINLGLIDRDLVEKSEAKVFDKLLDKLATEADLNILTHFGEQLESSLKHVGLESQKIVYEKIREVCYGKSKIREKQAMIWLSFCDFLPNILSPVQAITLYTKFLYQDGVLEERAILALTAFESMQFKEQLMSQLRCMTLPKEPAQASIVLFLRDIIGFCESSDCITDFLNILKSSRVDSKKTEYQLPNQIIGKMILLTLDSTQNVSSRAKRIMKNCTEKETVDKIVLDQAFLDEALERIWSSDSRHRYYCVEGVYLHLDRKMAKASKESTTVIKLIKIAQIAKIWEYVLKITDDIQDKPRLAALRLVKTGGSPLDKITQLIANETVTNHYGLKEQSETCLSELLKKLVFTLQTTKSGLTRAVCLMSMHSISQKNPSSLKLHAIELIKLLLESASGLESPKIQQISAQVEQFGTGELQNQLNEIKISSFYDSEMNEMLDACINLCDDESFMTPLQKDIVGIISSGIGVTTKCMAILSIPKLVPVIEKIGLDKNVPYYNGKFMAAMFKSLEDSQEAIYRRVIGSIVSVLRSSATKQSTVENVTQKIVKNYFEEKRSSNGPQLAKLCLALPQNILTGKPLSLCFLAQHAVCGEDEDLDAHRALVKLWTSAWKDNTPSELTALKTNKNFIIELCEEALTGEKWSMKQIGAKSLHSLIESLAEDCSFEDVAEKVKQVLMKSIKGTFWKGKKYSCAALIEMMVRNEKRYYCEESLKLVGAQLCSISADSDHKEGVKILVKKVIVAKFWGKMSSDLRKQFSKFAEDDSDMVEFFDNQMI